MTTTITELLDDNQERLDRMAFKLRLDELLCLHERHLREQLSQMACDTPHQCLQFCAAILTELRGLSSSFAGDKRHVVFYACRRALVAIENIDRATEKKPLRTI